MNTKITIKGLAAFYILVACLTYALIVRVEKLENGEQLNKSNNYVINFWK